MRLTPVAVFEGKVAASNMLNSTTTVPDYSPYRRPCSQSPNSSGSASSKQTPKPAELISLSAIRTRTLVFELPNRRNDRRSENPRRQGH